MYQELTSLYDQQCSDIILHDQSSFESEDSGSMQILYPFDSHYSETIPEDKINTAFELYVHQEEFNPQESSPPMSSLGSSQEETNLLHQTILPASADSSEMHWITSSSTDLRSQSPVTTSSPTHQVSNVSSFQYPSIAQTFENQSSKKSSSISTIVPSLSTQSDPVKNKAQPPSTQQPIANNTAPTKPKGTPGRKRKFQDHELSPAEAARRHIRRERNKLAAAKCRNRRRELTDRLQGETDHLEDHQQMLQQEIIALEREKKSLEFILATHSPNCKAGLANDISVYHQQQGAIDLSHTSAYQATDNGILTESDDSALAYLKKQGEMRLVNSVLTPHSTLPLSIPLSHNYSHQDSQFSSNDLVPVYSESRRIAEVDYTNTSPTTNRNFPRESTSNVTRSFRSSKILPKMNSFPLCTSTSLGATRMKRFEGSSMSSDDDYGRLGLANSSPSITSATASFSKNPYHQAGRSSQQFCSFDHHQQTSVDVRQRSDSVKSPKHLLAL